jgi:hypothetical protein
MVLALALSGTQYAASCVNSLRFARCAYQMNLGVRE